jgi:hypothetical protein
MGRKIDSFNFSGTDYIDFKKELSRVYRGLMRFDAV